MYLHLDDDPEYRNTPVNSGIPPPSSRDQRRNRQDNNVDLSRYNPALQRQQQQPRYSNYPDDPRRQSYNQQPRHDPHAYRSEHQHYHQQEAPQYAPQQQQQSKLKQPDFRTSTDFLKCEKRLSAKELVNIIAQQPSPNKDIDYDFLSSSALVEKMNQLRVRYIHICKIFKFLIVH